MAKEIDQCFYIGNSQCVSFIDGDYIQNMLSRTDEGDNQRRTEGYYLIPADALLDGC